MGRGRVRSTQKRRPERGGEVAVSRRLLSWYRIHRRDLPWRRTRDPYRIWVSEIMLQQTQVGTVIPYFNRFVERFPTVKALADAPLQSVLKLWEGLGYYSRARNLHQAARLVVESWEGKVPDDPTALESLPGIGRSTAGAILSIAYGKKAPILDGNVRRVIGRLYAFRGDLTKPGPQRKLWRASENLIPDRHSGDFNQALMELGATVCLPKSPQCLLCPVAAECRARRMGVQDQIPARKPKKPVPSHRTWIGLVKMGDSILIGRRPEKGLLAGLWGPPEIPASTGRVGPLRIRNVFSRALHLELEFIGPLDPVVHTFSHRRVTYIPYLFTCRMDSEAPPPPWRWVEASRLSEFPQSTATRRILNQIHPLSQELEANLLAAERGEPYADSGARASNPSI